MKKFLILLMVVLLLSVSAFAAETRDKIQKTEVDIDFYDNYTVDPSEFYTKRGFLAFDSSKKQLKARVFNVTKEITTKICQNQTRVKDGKSNTKEVCQNTKVNVTREVTKLAKITIVKGCTNGDWYRVYRYPGYTTSEDTVKELGQSIGSYRCHNNRVKVDISSFSSYTAEQVSALFDHGVFALEFEDGGDLTTDSLTGTSFELFGGVTQNDTGRSNTEYSSVFDGTSGMLNTSSNFGNYASWSASFWFMYDSSLTGDDSIFGKSESTASTDNEYWVDLYLNKLRFGYNVGSVNVQTAATTLSQDTWYHAVVTWENSGRAIIWLNNVTDLNFSAGTLSHKSAPLGIGSRSGGYTKYAGVYIDQFYFFDKAINHTDVNYLYTNGSLPAATLTTNISVSINSPTATSYNFGLVDLNYTVTNASQIDTCWYTTDGGATNTTLASCGNLTPSYYTNGSYTVDVYANQTDGITVSDSVTFTSSILTPTLSINYPTTGVIDLKVTELNYSVGDGRNVDQCWYNTGGSNTTVSNCANITALSVANGQHTWVVYANNTDGVIVSDSVTFTQNTPIAINIDSPSQSEYTSGFIDLNFSVSNYSLVDSCWYVLDGGANTSLPSCNNISSFYFADEGHDLYLYANYTLDSSVVSDYVDFNVSILTPTLSMQFPENTTYNTSLTEINFTVGTSRNLDSCWYNLGESSVYPGNCNNITGLNVSNGEHTWIVYVNNTDGDVITASATFTQNDPNKTTSEPSSGGGGGGGGGSSSNEDTDESSDEPNEEEEGWGNTVFGGVIALVILIGLGIAFTIYFLSR